MKFTVLLLSVLLCASNCFGDNNIVWMNTDYPPVGIASGPYRDQGIVDSIAKAISKEMPEKNHHYQRANLKRILHSLATGEQACIAGLIKTDERARSIHYNEVQTAVLTPLAIVVRAEDVNKFTSTGEVSLEKLLQEDKFRIGISESISFSSGIDELFQKYADNKTLQRIPMDNLLQNFLKMMEQQRIDYTLAYPWMVDFFAEQIGMKDKFISLPMKESQKPIVYYAACSKTMWGKQMARDIDRVLRKIKHTPEYRKIMETWIPAEFLPGYNESYKQFLSN